MSLDNEIVRRGYFSVVRNPRDGMVRIVQCTMIMNTLSV